MDLALEYQAEKNAMCSGCGHPLDETSDPENLRLYRVEEIHCQGCAVKAWRAKTIRDEERDPAGTRLVVLKR